VLAFTLLEGRVCTWRGSVLLVVLFSMGDDSHVSIDCSSGRGLLVFGSLAAALACGYSAPTAPDSSTPSGPEGASISITSSGVTPGSVMIAAGQSVTFVNNDSVPHNISSGPIPTYDECPSINRVGELAPGQKMQTAALSPGRSCSFIDLSRAGDPRWQGTITVQ
jgi:plastocyanin